MLNGPDYTPEDLLTAFPLVPKEKKSGKAASTKRPSISPSSKVESAIIGIFHALGVNMSRAKDLGDGVGYDTTCPWGEHHTDGVNDQRQFLAIWPDGTPRHWLCRHSHCSDRNLEDVFTLARSRGIEVPNFKANSPRSDRPSILICSPEYRVADAARKALSDLPGVYARRGRLVHVHRHVGDEGKRTIPAGAVGIKNAASAWVRERLSEAAHWERPTKKKDGSGFDHHPSLVPDWVGAMILEAPGAEFPELRAVTTAPVFLADGSIHADPGVLRDGVLYLGLANFPDVLDRPTEKDAQAAWDRIQTLVEDFPFASVPSKEAHRAAFLAVLLTIVARYAFNEPCPWVLFEANSQAAGKGLLAQTVAILTTGQTAPLMSCPREETELRKSILPVLIDATRVQVLDEIHPGFGGPEWNAMVTAILYTGRILGTSLTVTVPNDTIWICMGNNVGLLPDTTRRALSLRLEPMEEHPEDRTGFKIPDLLSYVRDHQPELLRDLLTILRAFHVAGRPASDLSPWGSFPAWSTLVRDAVYWVAKVDPDCRKALASVADMGRIIHADLVAELHAKFGKNPFTTGSVIEASISSPGLCTALEAACPSKDGKLKAVSIGKRFASFRRRPVSGMMLDQQPGEDRKGGALWCIRAIEAVPLQHVEADGWEVA